MFENLILLVQNFSETKDNLINKSISILVIHRGGKAVSLEISVNLMIKRLILVLFKSEHYFKTSACDVLTGKGWGGLEFYCQMA